MEDFPFLQLSAYMGLVATGLLTLNILLGMMLSTAYKKHVYWIKLPARIRQINIYNLHNWTAYIVLLLVLLHPTLLLLAPATKFKFIDIIFPINAPHQKLFVALGTLSLFAIITVVITTQKLVKKKMSLRIWKNIHLISYGTLLLFIVHGIVMDPELKDRPLMLLDAEKLLSELCLIILVAASVIRYKYHLKTKQKNKKLAIIPTEKM